MKKSFSIAIFTSTYFPLIGGAQVAIREVCKLNQGIQFTLFCPRLNRKHPKKDRLDNVTVIRIGLGTQYDKYIFPLMAPIKVFFSSLKPDIVWGVMASQGSLGGLWYSKLIRKPFLLSLQEGSSVKELRKLIGFSYKIMGYIIRRASHVHAISRFVVEMAVELSKTAQFPHSIIPNGVNLSIFSPDKPIARHIVTAYKIESSERILFSASRLSYKNAIDDLLKAMKLLPDNYRLFLAGTGPKERELKTYCNENGLNERVQFLGDIAQEMVAEHLTIAHLFVRPSLREGLGNSFLEAMGMGVPIVACLVGGIKDYLVHGETGIAVEPKNPDSIAQGILAYEDTKLYEKIRGNGTRLVREKYTWDVVARSMGKIFREEGQGRG